MSFPVAALTALLASRTLPCLLLGQHPCKGSHPSLLFFLIVATCRAGYVASARGIPSRGALLPSRPLTGAGSGGEGAPCHRSSASAFPATLSRLRVVRNVH